MGSSAPFAALGEERRPPVLEVRGERCTGRPAEQPDPLLPALAHDPDLAAPELDRTEIGGRELADPETRCVRRLDQRPIAERERGQQWCARRVGCVGVGKLVIDGRQQLLDLLDLEDAGQPSRQARGRRSRPTDHRPTGLPAPRAGGMIGSPPSAGRWSSSRPEPRDERDRHAGRLATGCRQSTPRSASQSRYAPIDVRYERWVWSDASRAARVAEEPLERGVGRWRPAHASGALSVRRVRRGAARVPPARPDPVCRPRPPRTGTATGAAAAAPAAGRLRECLRVRRPASQSGADELRALGQRYVGAALEADRRLALPGNGPLVCVVKRTDGFEVRREVALRIGGAAPEDVAGAAGAAGDEVAVAVLRAGDLERQRVGRRWTLSLDVVAVRVAGAADERPEPAASCRRACPRRTAGRPPPRLPGAAAPHRAAAVIPCAPGTCEQARNRPFRPSRITIGWPSEQTSSVGSVVKSAA